MSQAVNNQIKCCNDTDGDGDCHECYRKGGCNKYYMTIYPDDEAAKSASLKRQPRQSRRMR